MEMPIKSPFAYAFWKYIRNLIKHLSGRNHLKESYSVPQAICSDQYYYYHRTVQLH